MSVSKQSIFDRVAKHLLSQKKRAMDEDEFACKYRAPDGAKCAVGCLISDQVYKPKFEGKDIFTLNERYAKQLPKYFKEHELFLSELQSIHDVHEPSAWRRHLTLFATKHKLKRTALGRARA